MRLAFIALSASLSLSSLVGCSAGEPGSPAPDPAVAQDAGQSADVDAGALDPNDAASKGTPCVESSECPSFVCPKCPAAVLQECTGSHVCATEEQICASITCDEPDAK